MHPSVNVSAIIDGSKPTDILSDNDVKGTAIKGTKVTGSSPAFASDQ
jgi:hypothetical protein